VAKNGLIDVKTAKNLGISKYFISTKNAYIAFSDALKRGKDLVP
jgi:hypothetical protein